MFFWLGVVEEWGRSCRVERGIASHNFEASSAFNYYVGSSYSLIISLKLSRQYSKQSASNYEICRKLADTSIGIKLPGVRGSLVGCSLM